MNLIELERSLRQLRLGGMAVVLETRLRQAQAETMTPIDLISCLVSDELTRRSDRLLERRRKQAAFRPTRFVARHYLQHNSLLMLCTDYCLASRKVSSPKARSAPIPCWRCE
jgi:hypothetical protein